jgi:hypothetical protein
MNAGRPTAGARASTVPARDGNRLRAECPEVLRARYTTVGSMLWARNAVRISGDTAESVMIR